MLEVVGLDEDMRPPRLPRCLLPGDHHAQGQHQHKGDDQQRDRIDPEGPHQDPSVFERQLCPLVPLDGLQPAADQVDGHGGGHEQAETDEHALPPVASRPGLLPPLDHCGSPNLGVTPSPAAVRLKPLYYAANARFQ